MLGPQSTSLKLQWLYGLKGDVKDNIHYSDEYSVVYPCGYNLVHYNIEKKTQRFIPLASTANSSGTGDITCMAVSSMRSATSGRPRVVAVAERGGPNGRPSITVYDLTESHKRRGKGPLESKEVASKKYVSMCFSPDGKYLLAQGGPPDWTLINWQWEKSRPLQAARVSNKVGSAIYQCSYCPMDPTVVCVSGNGILRFLHLEQSEFKSIQFSMGKREPQNYLCHCWIDDKILVGTDTGDIFVFENAEFKGVLDSSPSDGKSIDSLAAYSSHPSGFVAGCDEGVLYVFERDEKEIFKQSKFFQIESNFVRIKNIAISPSEDNVICSLENNQAFVLGIQNTDILKTEEMNFEPLSVPCHHLQITGMDVCMRKPLVVTCGLDRSVRVWNYMTHTIEVMRYFSEAPLSVAFHPSGLHIIAGFYDSLRLMNLLMGEIRPYKDFTIKGCREVQFSNGGQYFAAANGTLIQVYQTFTCDLVQQIPHKNKVTSLCWTKDDDSIISAGLEGGVYQWFMKENKQVMAPNLKRLGKCNYSCAVAGLADGRIYVVGTDRKLKTIDPQTEATQIDADVILTQISLMPPKAPNTKHAACFAGTETGAVRLYSFNSENSFQEHFVHSQAVSRTRITPDGQFLLTVSEDGSLAQFAIESKQKGTGVAREHTLPPAEEILVAKADLEQKMALIQDLQSKVEDLQNHNELQLQLREMTYREKYRDVTQKFLNEMEIDKTRYQALEDEKAAMQRHFALQITAHNAGQSQKLDELEKHFAEKLKSENKRYQELERKIADLQEHWSVQTEIQQDKYEKELKETEELYDSRLESAIHAREDLNSLSDQVKKDKLEYETLLEEDADQEIDELKAAYDKKLTDEIRETLKLKEHNAILWRKFQNHLNDIHEKDADIQKNEQKVADLDLKIGTLEKDIKGHQKEIKERLSTIADKHHPIFELKKKNQELEKFKFVLDYKITELKRLIEPKKVETRDLGQQIAQMEAELKQYRDESSHLSLDLKKLNLKLNGMEKEIKQTNKERAAVASSLKRFKTDLHETHMHLDDAKELKAHTKRLYQRHVQNEFTASMKQGAADVHKDYQRQRKFLEKSVDSLQSKLGKDMLVHKKENMRITKENIALIREINQLRREISILRSAQKLKDQSKNAARVQRLETIAKSQAERRRQIEDEMSRQQEQIRALKAQISTYKRMASEAEPRPPSQGTSLPPIDPAKSNRQSNAASVRNSRPGTQGGATGSRPGTTGGADLAETRPLSGQLQQQPQPA